MNSLSFAFDFVPFVIPADALSLHPADVREVSKFSCLVGVSLIDKSECSLNCSDLRERVEPGPVGAEMGLPCNP